MVNKNIIFILIFIALSLYGVKALFAPGYFTSHDGWHQVARLYYFHESIKDGVFPPSYVSTLYNGFGYPLFIFNYQLPFFIGSVFMNFGLSVFDSIKSVYIIGYLFSGFTMYYYLRSRYSSLPSLVGSVIYLWSPYRFLNIFVRNSIGEATLFIFIPILLLAVDKLIEKFSWRYILIGSLSIAALIISHAIGALFVSLFVFLYAVINIVATKKTASLRNIFILFIFGFMLGSYYLLPAFIHKNVTNFNLSIQSTSYDGQYVALKQLLYSKWGYGFANSEFDRMSFQVGIINWITVILAVLLIVKKYKRAFSKYRQPLSILIIFALSIFFITPYSNTIWDTIINKVFFVDFHWRLLSISVTASAILAAFVISSLNKKLRVIIAILFIIICLYTNRNHLRVNLYTNVPLSLYLLSEISTNTYDEYLPIKAHSKYAKDSESGGNLIVNGNEIEPSVQRVNYYRYNISHYAESKYLINLFYFPGWKVYIDDLETPIERTGQGFMSVIVPEDSSVFDVVYEGTFLMVLSKWISILTLIIVIMFAYRERKSNKIN